MSESDDKIEGWYIVELMGHRKLGGYLREVTVAGAPMLRLDVPAAPASESLGKEAFAGVTQIYSAAAVYCLTPTTEDICLRMAARYQPAPVTRFELPKPEVTRVAIRETQGTFAEAERDLDDEF